MGQLHPVRARVVRVHGFSGHADRDGLFRWLSNIKQPPKTIFLVHGETNSATSFAEYLKQKTNWNVQIPNYLDQAILH
jgi:metallo-beta-lactamase family protein